MNAELLEIEKKAMSLSAKDRAELAEHLLASLDDLAGNELEEMRACEAEKRYQAYVGGRIKSRDMDDAISDVREKLK
ncbi:MAG: addiction module protein [Planctomycetota bacterium]|jgi:hypothetical protein